MADKSDRWFRRYAGEILLAVGFTVLYLTTAVTTLVGGDAGLFATIFADGGYGHPPGYPLYSLYLQALSWVPATSPMHGASMATALLGAASVVVLFRALRSWNAQPFAAGFGAVSFGLGSHVWLFHTQPEVFALNHLLAALLLWLAGPHPPVSGRTRVAVLGLVAGLGLANHHTIALMAPIGLWGVHRATKEADGHPLGTICFGALTLGAGLIPYGYLLVVEQVGSGWHWGTPDSFNDLLHLFFRKDYGTFSMAADESPTGAVSQIGFLGRAIARDVLYLPAAAAVVGLVAAVSDTSDSGLRWPAVALGLSFILCGPFFVTLLTRHPEGIDYLLIRRFHLLPQLHLAFFAGLGLQTLAHHFRHRWLRAVALGGFVAAAIAVGIGEKHRHHAPTVDQYVRDSFTSLPDDAIVLGTGDHHFFGALYLQNGLEHRSDLTYIDAILLAHRWYNERITHRVGIEFPYRGEEIDLKHLIDVLLATDRPLFVTGLFHDSLLDGRPSAPYGTFIRIYPPAHPPPSPPEVFRTNVRLFQSFTIEPRPSASSSTWSRFLLDEYAGAWRTLAPVLEKTGHSELAEKSRQFAEQFAPWAVN